MHVSPQRRTILQHQDLQKWSKHVMFCAFSLPNVPFATGVCIFFNIRTYKSGPKTSCFVHFHCRMYLSPQERAFFQHQNLQKWSKHVMFCTFSLPNVLFATAACIFSTSELTKVVQTRHVLYIFTSECAFRHSGVQFFICLLSTYLRTRRFNRPTFRLT